MAPPVTATSTRFMASSMPIMEISDMPMAVLMQAQALCRSSSFKHDGGEQAIAIAGHNRPNRPRDACVLKIGNGAEIANGAPAGTLACSMTLGRYVCSASGMSLA